MAIIHHKFLKYLSTTQQKALTLNSPIYYHDKLLALIEKCYSTEENQLEFTKHYSFSDSVLTQAKESYKNYGVVGIFSAYFDNCITSQFVPVEIERKVICLKHGFPHMPATTVSTIIKGFGHNLNDTEVRWIFSSYGLAQGMKLLRSAYNWEELNRRVSFLSQVIQNKQELHSEIHSIENRYRAIRLYLCADKRKKEIALKQGRLKRSLFFYYWKSFKHYGLIGLIDKGKEVFRTSKVGIANEAFIVIDKLQKPDTHESFYVQLLQTKGIRINRSCIAKILSRWHIKSYQTQFVSNLKRLEIDDQSQHHDQSPLHYDDEKKGDKWVDQNFAIMFKGMVENGLYVSAPGIFVLWAYMEELGIFPILSAMDLTQPAKKKGYIWIDFLLLDIARRFYGIESHSRMCSQEEPTLAFFSHLLTLPSNDALLNGLASIDQTQLFDLRRWLIRRNKELELLNPKKIAFDFHQIDLDVELSQLRQFGKGPSWKKKICYNGFRPHIAWDLETNNIIVAEFRKASARGTTTVKRFVNEFVLATFKELFETVYIDSEYTGKNVWSFILDTKDGMGAQVTACLKQNTLVKKLRDQFILQNSTDESFWQFWDENHVHSAKSFTLHWQYDNQSKKQSSSLKEFTLYCVVKKNIKNGRLRCFGTSKNNLTPRMILEDYSHRWNIENGIKDLIKSYYLNKCPGCDPHHVDVHFFCVALCRNIYRMIERDLGEYVKNPDGSTKTLSTMRETLFREGCARIYRKEDTIEIKFLQRYKPQLTEVLKMWFKKLENRFPEGMNIIGGFKIKFSLLTPHGEEYRNLLTKIPLRKLKNLGQ